MNVLRLLLLTTLAVAKQPNILFILTDDQGKYVGGLEHMPNLQVGLCLPSKPYFLRPRTNTLTSKPSFNKEQATPSISAQLHYAVHPEPTSGPAACPTTRTSPTSDFPTAAIQK